MKTEKQLRKEISSKVRDIAKLREKGRRFTPGKDPVNYAGRIYDAEEMINLVDSSVDFWLTAGKYAKEFETKMAAFLGARHCLMVNSGSSANLLAISALTSPLLGNRRLRPGDEVITTACGFPTTLNPILQCGLVPVFVDVELGTYNIDSRKLEGAVSAKTKAIFVPHTLGNPANMSKITEITKKYNLWLIEDNCDALGSRYGGRFTGTFGDIGTLSFYPAHHITMGEGGAVVTNDTLLKKVLLSMRDWGRDCWCEPGADDTCRKRFSQKFAGLPEGYDHKYVYSHIGYNLKATDMQAAIGVAQLKKLNRFIEARKRNFERLNGCLGKYEEHFMLPIAEAGSDPSWFGFPILVRKEAAFGRNDIVNFLEDNKVATRMLFGGNLLKQPAYREIDCRVHGSLENTDMVMNNLFWIGVYPGIDERRIEYVISKFEEFIKKYENQKN
ncbi:MAG: lipopolysaccharide biosynthesis protein RfbH [Endomicrobiales bacterium]|nr:lipopolysaccharide biosynthesis protein RfbH [Endomicrobiales bacterium]